jgi:serine/threonine protein kinase
VLLDEQLHAKIIDFGVSTRFQSTVVCDIASKSSADADTGTGTGTTRYMAPEVVFGPYDEKADIYSFGLLMWETLHGAKPFGAISPIATALQVISGKRPALQLSAPDANFKPLIEICWGQNPKSRPTISVIVEEIERLRAEVLEV